MKSLIIIPFFIIFCINCTEGNQQILGSNGDVYLAQNLSSFDHIGSYSIDSFALAFSQSSLFKKNLSRREEAIFSFSSMVLSDYVEDGLSEALDLRYDKAEGYRVKYMTPDPYKRSKHIKASGLAIIPVSDKALPLLIYFHPTLLHKNQAPSLISPSLIAMDPIEDPRLMMIFLALQGYIVFAPDYIGYGSSENMIHPYLYKKSVVQTAGSLLYALEQALTEDRISFRRELFIMGYSQGGHGALAFAQTLRDSPMDFQIQAVSAGGGPYDMLYTVKEHLNQEKAWRILLTLLLQSYSYIYNWDLDDIVKRKSYADIIDDAYKHDSLSRAVEDLPDRISSLFQSQFIHDVLEGDARNDYQFFLEENSVYDWEPDFPVFLFHAKNDQIVPYRNMEIAYRSLNGGRARVSRKDCSFKKVKRIVDVIEKLDRGNHNIEPDHINCNFIFFLETGDYFSDL